MIGVIIISPLFLRSPPRGHIAGMRRGGGRVGTHPSQAPTDGADLNGCRGQRPAGSNAYRCDAGAVKALFLMRSL